MYAGYCKVQKQVLSRICPGFNLKILTKDWNPVLCEDFGRDEARGLTCPTFYQTFDAHITCIFRKGS